MGKNVALVTVGFFAGVVFTAARVVFLEMGGFDFSDIVPKNEEEAEVKINRWRRKYSEPKR